MYLTTNHSHASAYLLATKCLTYLSTFIVKSIHLHSPRASPRVLLSMCDLAKIFLVSSKFSYISGLHSCVYCTLLFLKGVHCVCLPTKRGVFHQLFLCMQLRDHSSYPLGLIFMYPPNFQVSSQFSF
jgi:hypothetical protein